ncbi:PspA/IM30 family protein [Paenibacillus filicis]|uniref:PspA/IM30 family protein n=1 Tax=Paenibacillus gyeongsangnamensis TaxID=3388067 RepID=A0ABT4QAS0_9BACL|nr:PspA/IM30 family protein [Paenibacillus filicis]MCZ8513977.1 PspA/IM30 family protein [Paenibacillus filicis]
MGALRRLMDLTKAVVNETLDKMEKPVMMLNQYLRSMEEELHALQRELTKETASSRTWEQQIAGCFRQAEQSEQKAREALADDRTIEARQALEARQTYLDQAAEYTRAYEASKLRTAELEQQLKQAQTEYASMQAKRDELMQRAQKVQDKEQTAASSFGYRADTGAAVHGFQRIEERIMQKEAQLEYAESMKAAATASREALIEEQLTRLRNEAPVHK